MTETLPTWRNACTPHRDIREDAISEALFAVNPSRAIADQGRFGCAAVVTLNGYVGPPEELPPDTHLIRLHRDAVYPRTVSPMSLANVMKTAISLSKLGEEEAPIALELSLELKGR